MGVNFELRPWSFSDLESLVKYANNPAIARNLTNQFPHPYLVQHGRQFIEMAMSHHPVRIFAIEINGEAAGGIGIHPQNDVYCTNAELGYWLAETYWGNGIITQSIIQMIAYGFKNFEINRIFARPSGSNKASQRVLEKAGFVLEATLKGTFLKNGVVEDELIYAVRRNNLGK
ncbi:MAG TPA: GNAT family protein [Bacteroidia bacterium]|nr:GNAT family protein [Bacteroidia bacterium]